LVERSNQQSESPRSKPEIILPDDDAGPRAAQSSARMRVFVDTHGAERIYVTKVGPLGIILVMLVTGILSAAILVLLLGTFLIWMPVVVLLVVAALIGGLFRRYF
jgi:hypothetical protein